MELSDSAVIVGLILLQGVLAYWIKDRLRQSITYEYGVQMESIKRGHSIELEEMKKELEFELDKRKRLYEGKLAQYKKYFTMLDSYQERARQRVFGGFQEGMLSVINDPSGENVQRYIQSIMTVQSDLGDDYLKFKTELNGLRLEAGITLLDLLDEYIECLDVAQDQTVKFLTDANASIMASVANPNAVQGDVSQRMQDEFSEIGPELINLQSKIFFEMRRELGIE